MTRRDKQWRRILSTSLLEATIPSDEVGSNSDCENRTVVWFENCWKKRHAGTWLSRLPLTTKLKWQVRDSSVPEAYQSWMQPSSLGNQLQTWDCPPAIGGSHTHSTLTAAPWRLEAFCTGRPAPQRTHHSNSSTLKQHFAAATCSGASRPAGKRTRHSQQHLQAAPCSGTSRPAPKRTHH